MNMLYSTEELAQMPLEEYFRKASKDYILSIDKTRRIRVAVYARVSTEHEEQIEALKNQIQWYKDLISAHPNWIFDEDEHLYVDEGISGTSEKHRKSFERMKKDAFNTEFDIVITREVCRFARNVEDTFRVTRELREKGVGVYFVSDDIWSFDDSTSGTIKLSIMAGLAQSESQKISERTKNGQKVVRENGYISLTQDFLGYKVTKGVKAKDKTLIINEEQAKIVRFVFEKYTCDNPEERLGYVNIVKELVQREWKTCSGDLNWSASKIGRIIRNEKYMGYTAGYVKTETVNCITHERKVQDIEPVRTLYDAEGNIIQKGNLIKGNWLPIIDEETWWKAQDIRKGKYDRYSNSEGDRKIKKGHKEVINIWQRKAKCECGFGMNPIMLHDERIDRKGNVVPAQIGFRCYNAVNRAGQKLMMQENNEFEFSTMCRVDTVNNFTYEVSAVKIMELLLGDSKNAVLRAIEIINECYVAEKRDNSKEVESLDKSIAKLKKRIDKFSIMRADGEIDKEEYIRYTDEAKAEKRELEASRKKLVAEAEEEQTVSLNMDVVKEKLNSYLELKDNRVDRRLLNRLVKTIYNREGNEFVWVMNFDSLDIIDKPERIEQFSEERRQYLKDDKNFNIFYEFEISLDECAEYAKKLNRQFRRRYWKPIKIKLAY